MAPTKPAVVPTRTIAIGGEVVTRFGISSGGDTGQSAAEKATSRED
jgi:hypothetical protein